MARKIPHQNTENATIADVIEWAKQSMLPRDTIYELRKIAPRLGLSEQDLTSVPAQLEYFQAVIAKTPYGTVSNASNLDAAQKRGNSRVRSCLEKFHGKTGSVSSDVTADYTKLISFVKSHEGFVDRGAAFPTGRHLCLYTLRSVAQMPLADLNQNEVDRIFHESTSETRKILKKAIKFLSSLKFGGLNMDDIANLLPAADIQVPESCNLSARLTWAEFPIAFRKASEALFSEILVHPEHLAQHARKMMKSGATSEEINRFIAERTIGRTRISKNNAAAIVSYRSALTWVARTFTEDRPLSDLTCPTQLFHRDLIQRTIDSQIARSNSSMLLKDANKSCTLNSRLTSLKTIARHGLRSVEALADLEALTTAYKDFIIKQREMTDEADAICTALQNNPRLAARLVNAPTNLALFAKQALTSAKEANDERKELEALRIFSVAALYAIQLSRPLRTRNLITLRHRPLPDMKPNLRWIVDGKRAEIRFSAMETKNERRVQVTVWGTDAQILWDWHTIHRSRFVELSGCSDSPYLFPGSATPRLVRNGLTLPSGTMSPSSFAQNWRKGDKVIGLGLTPHSCRHAVATLLLAMEPGNFAKVAAVLADTEETVRKHYGKDSGQSAATAVRSVLLAEHPDLFKKIGGASPMNKSTLEARLSSTPVSVRRSMLDAHGKLPAGAASVIDRLFAISAANGEPHDCPSEHSFRQACKSEATFRLLLRTLALHAPTVSTAAAIAVKNEWTSKRVKPAPEARTKEVASTDTAFGVTDWPSTWQAHFSSFRHVPIKPSSLKRYIASINRCAQIIRENKLPEDLTFLTAFEIAEHLSKCSKPVAAITIANYLDGLYALGFHGGADRTGLTGLAFVSQNLRNLARSAEKQKTARIDALIARGAFEHIAKVIADLRRLADNSPGH